MHRIAIIVASILSIFIASPAFAQVVITQAKALAGSVTPGDAPGYPVTLSQPGAYVLESNLTVTLGTYGLFVTANNVDIDMKGFVLTGNGGGTYGLISGFGESSIHGGVINLFRNAGIYLRNNAWVIKDMQIVRNGGMGIDAGRLRFIRVEDSTIAANGSYGVYVGDSAIIRNNIISENSSGGITCKLNCQIEINKIEISGGYGIEIDSGYVLQNLIVGSRYQGLYDFGRFDSALSENTFIDNNGVGTYQVAGAIFAQGNTCIGKPCTAP